MIHQAMARFNRALRPINRIKHVKDEQGGMVAGTTVTVVIAEAKDAPVLANTAEVQTGSTINGFFAAVEVVATSSAALSNVYAIFYKNPGNNLTMPAGNVVGSNDNKKYVFHQEMVMLQEQTGSNPRTLFKGVLKVPKHMRRMGPGDLIGLKMLAPGNAMNYCTQFHYKEFR